MEANVIDRVMERAATIKSGLGKVKPGETVHLSPACVKGDYVRQGDLYLVVADNRKPQGYVRVENPTELDCQLVPGNTTGARHCLEALTGVELFRPEKWDEESLDGPFLRLSQETRVLHPTHGTVVLPAGVAIRCAYQRVYDLEQKRERRARD